MASSDSEHGLIQYALYIPESLKDLERECNSLFATCSKGNEDEIQRHDGIKVFEIPDQCLESSVTIDEFKTDQYHPLCCKVKNAVKVSQSERA